MKRRNVLICIFLLALLVSTLFTSCFLQTKEEQNNTRVEKIYDNFHRSLRSGRLPAEFDTEMIARPIDEKLLQDAASSYPKEKRGPFHFDTVKFTKDGDLAFISVNGPSDYAVVQHPDFTWWFIDDVFESPLVVKDDSVTRALGDQVKVPESWTVFAESQSTLQPDNVLQSTFYFIETEFDEMVEHFRLLMKPGDTEEVDEVLGDVLFTFYGDDGKTVEYEVLVWQIVTSEEELPSGEVSTTSIKVVDMADYTKAK